MAETQGNGNGHGYVGTRTIRPDGMDKVTGRARFGADFSLPGQLIGRVLRSPHPHARIVHLDVSAARRVPGVHAVLTGADLPRGLVGIRIRDMPLLARDRVRYIGERVHFRPVCPVWDNPAQVRSCVHHGTQEARCRDCHRVPHPLARGQHRLAPD